MAPDPTANLFSAMNNDNVTETNTAIKLDSGTVLTHHVLNNAFYVYLSSSEETLTLRRPLDTSGGSDDPQQYQRWFPLAIFTQLPYVSVSVLQHAGVKW